MTTVNREINGGPFDLVLAPGVATDVIFRCTGFRSASVQFRNNGANAIGTCSVALGNEPDLANNVVDATASAAMIPIAAAASRLYERGLTTSYMSFSLTSALGTTVHITSVASVEASPSTTLVDSKAI